MKMNPAVHSAIEDNKKNALCATLLLLPKVFSEFELYLGIASLSYIGDPRMLYGENPKKVINLVSPIVHIYRESYKNIIKDLQSQRLAHSGTSFKLLNHVENDSKNTLYTQDVSVQSRWGLAEVILFIFIYFLSLEAKYQSTLLYLFSYISLIMLGIAMAFKEIALCQYEKKIFEEVPQHSQEATLFRSDTDSIGIYCNAISGASKRQRSPNCWNREMFTVSSGEAGQKISKYTSLW